MRMFASFILLGLLAGVPTFAEEPKSSPARLEDKLKVPLLKANPDDDRLRKLQVQHFNELASELRMLLVLMVHGDPSRPPDVFGVTRRLLQAAADFGEPKDRVPILSALLKLGKELEKIKEHQHKAKMIGPDVVHRFRALTLEIEINLVRTESKLRGAR